MANSCYNFIEITGDKKQLKKLIKDLVPESDVYINLCHKYGKGERDAKWFNIDVNVQVYNIHLLGDSAWRPSLGLFTSISKKFPKLTFKYSYEEMGCDFSGWADIANGICNDNIFPYWEGIIARDGESVALAEVLENELECYDTEEELIESKMYSSFGEESRLEILDNYKIINE